MSRIFAIESSCDDTSVALVCDTGGVFQVEKIYAYSQIADHQAYHGVVPELAYRIHSDKILGLIDEIGLHEIKSCDAIAVTTHPGLPGSLMVGITVGQTLSRFLGLPFVSINHIDGHLASLLLDRRLEDVALPIVVLSASGGHTTLFHITREPCTDAHQLGPRWIQTLGSTLDDASGECFDKVSTMLGGPYPGGPWIDTKARAGRPNNLVTYRPIMLGKGSLDFSFSGMKSQTHQLLVRLSKQGIRLDDQLICDIAYQFQETMIDVLIKKIKIALAQTGAMSLGIVGGVSANTRLQQSTQMLIDQGIRYYTPLKMSYCVDNAAMIGVAGLLKMGS